jgi:hypothetical protein
VSIAALITWVLAASMGAFLLLTWISNGGLQKGTEGRASRFAPPLILGHAGLAAVGLAIWVWYLVSGAKALPWVCLGVLVVVASLGLTMFGLWFAAGNITRGRHAHKPRHAAEDHLPPPAVLVHGMFAVTTVVLVVLTAV